MVSETARNKNDFEPDLPSQAQRPSADADQQSASNPLESVWVSASAGTGKTKVLTDRLLRLLLPKKDGSAGTDPHKILCLTFTKAAANEMTIRLFETLSRWAVMPVDAVFESQERKNFLKGALERLIGEEPTELQVQAARQLFARVLDAPSGIRILTIHSFCQSVLGRFPLEADLSPNFAVLEDSESRELIAQAQRDVFMQASSLEEAGSPLQNAMISLTSEQNEEQFIRLAGAVCSERAQFAKVLEAHRDIEAVYAEICRFYDVIPGQDADGFLRDTLFLEPAEEELLKSAARIAAEGSGKNEKERGEALLHWLSLSRGDRLGMFELYKRCFLTSAGELYSKTFLTKKRVEEFSHYEEILQKEAIRVDRIVQTLKKINCSAWARDLLILGDAVNRKYEALKRSKSVLDYDDLILRTYHLLTGQTLRFQSLRDDSAGEDIEVTPWIMYKLDRGIDHILVDEAQDTNPEQWKIIEALSDDFFSGAGAQEGRRTCFTVGDMKQSIYSFQRAAPEEFNRMRGVFGEKIRAIGQEMFEIPLKSSFRSSRAVLDLVDVVFDRDDLRAALGGENVSHISTRMGQAGRVELWPVFKTETSEAREFWDPPVTVREGQKASSALAQEIADTIESWITSGDLLEAYDRPVQPGDILILVRTRIAFVDELIRALKQRRIPVSGADRMHLEAQLVVQDLLAAAKFCLLPDDDLTLACLLKSPLIGWGDSELFSLATDRTGDLWSELVHFGSRTYHRLLDDPDGLEAGRVEQAVCYLKELREASEQSGVYEFFSWILHRPCPGHTESGVMAIKQRLGEDAADPLQEFLNAALDFGRSHPDMLQLFVEHFESRHMEIKREMEEAGGQVRIMTVHGSKGLQAPIVILPDTVASTNSGKAPTLLWPDKTGLSFPLWAPRQGDAPRDYHRVRDRVKAKLEEESNRLLYVAMTRAADRLYVCGFKGSRSGSEESWHDKIRQGFERLEPVVRDENKRLRYVISQTRPPDKVRAPAEKGADEEPLPVWLKRPAPGEPDPPRPLVPSRASEEEDSFPVLSPLADSHAYRFLRGNVTHKLLQFLPSFDAEARASAAEMYVNKHGAALDEDQRASIVREVLAVMNDPETRVFFAEDGLAEVPVTALLGGNKILSGQIDRLVVRTDDVWILDYKTNRPPPERVAEVPGLYLRQMKAYRDAVRAIYPGKAIVCALLWTDGPRLMILPDAEMDKVT